MMRLSADGVIRSERAKRSTWRSEVIWNLVVGVRGFGRGCMLFFCFWLCEATLVCGVKSWVGMSVFRESGSDGVFLNHSKKTLLLLGLTF
jgi:hypothetical protein